MNVTAQNVEQWNLIGQLETMNGNISARLPSGAHPLLGEGGSAARLEMVRLHAIHCLQPANQNSLEIWAVIFMDSRWQRFGCEYAAGFVSAVLATGVHGRPMAPAWTVVQSISQSRAAYHVRFGHRSLKACSANVLCVVWSLWYLINPLFAAASAHTSLVEGGSAARLDQCTGWRKAKKEKQEDEQLWILTVLGWPL